ncbi:zf-HC2 domain-containing protein [Actinotalea sp.]|uniref:zf-HC2 domain-containing protein n=1 Tax=Actinotalea sp. TaxID=1872145 RepID=UPI003568D81B
MSGPGHLGTQLSALADGQLGPGAAERAMAHVASCAECTEGLVAAREARRALADAFEVRPTADLTARLLALGADQGGYRQGPAPRAAASAADEDPAAAWAGSRCVPLPTGRGGLPAGGLRGDVRPRRLPVAALTAGALAFGFVSVLFVLGGEPTTTPERHPAQALGLLSRAADAADGSARAVTVAQDVAGATDLLEQVAADADGSGPAVVEQEATAAWAHPVPVPEGYRVAAVRTVEAAVPTVEIDLVGPSGVIVVTQRLARLDLGGSDGVEVLLADRAVTVLSTAPWHVVWQSGDVMVDVVAEVPSTAVADLVLTAPVQAYDDGASARVVRGWQNLIESWSSL